MKSDGSSPAGSVVSGQGTNSVSVRFDERANNGAKVIVTYFIPPTNGGSYVSCGKSLTVATKSNPYPTINVGTNPST